MFKQKNLKKYFFSLLTLQEPSKISWFCIIIRQKSAKQNRMKDKHNMEVILISAWDKLL